ncbi:MAG: hypothetical protein AABX70_01410 [Nanoarchaeota archaeon]
MEEKRGDPSEAAFLRTQLRSETLSKMEAFHQQGFYDGGDFYYLVKNFFKQYLKLNYEFTIDELHTELKKIYLTETTRAQLDLILDHISSVECLSDKNQPSQVRADLDNFQQIVEALLDAENPSSITHFWEKLHLKNFFQKFTHPSTDSHQTLAQKIEELLPHLKKEIQDKNFESARNIYQQLMIYYGELEETDKARYYQQINDLYGILSTPLS